MDDAYRDLFAKRVSETHGHEVSTLLTIQEQRAHRKATKQTQLACVFPKATGCQQVSIT